MKTYINLLNNILDNGFDHEDRTGTGRRTLFGPQLEFDLRSGIPIVTTREINLEGIVRELQWFIMGIDDNSILKDNGINFWNKWAVDEVHIDQFLDKYLPPYDSDSDIELINQYNDIRERNKKQLINRYINRIGPIYGPIWRHLQVHKPIDVNVRKLSLDYLASDRIDIGKSFLKEQSDNIEGSESYNNMLQFLLYGVIDQLNEVIHGLRNRPYSARNIISTWIPEFLAWEDLSPQENVLLGRGALTPCHVLQQYFVENINGIPHLSMKLYQRLQ